MKDLSQALREMGQRLRLPMVGLVGGAVAARRNGPYPADNRGLPNIVLQISAVDGAGRRFTAGGWTVKNVSGFDLVKVLVGSRGTLATITEVLFRTEPIPRDSRWFVGTGDAALLFRPNLVFEVGGLTYVNLEGHPEDVREQAALLVGFDECPHPDDDWLAGIGSAHGLRGDFDETTLSICRRLKASFDPDNRLSPVLSAQWGLL